MCAGGNNFFRAHEDSRQSDGSLTSLLTSPPLCAFVQCPDVGKVQSHSFIITDEAGSISLLFSRETMTDDALWSLTNLFISYLLTAGAPSRYRRLDCAKMTLSSGSLRATGGDGQQWGTAVGSCQSRNVRSVHTRAGDRYSTG